MIIDFDINYNNYTEKILNNYSIYTYTCPKCGAKHSFTRHASYERNICCFDANFEIIEIKDHPFFVASQFHPEFKSRPLKPHPLFKEFIKAALRP